MIKNCELCGSLYTTKPSHAARRKYCSRACFETVHVANMSGDNNPAWKHGNAGRGEVTSEYDTWQHMRNRCENPTDKRWNRYGGRGIKVCERWQVFENFIADMGYKPTPAHSIERKDNDGNYCPENCVWATVKEQSRNRSTNLNVTYNGETMCLKDWAEKLGIKYLTVYKRFKSGKPLEVVFKQ